VVVYSVQAKGTFARIRCFQRRMFRRPNAKTTWYVQSRFTPIADNDLDLNCESTKLEVPRYFLDGKECREEIEDKQHKIDHCQKLRVLSCPFIYLDSLPWGPGHSEAI